METCCVFSRGEFFLASRSASSACSPLNCGPAVTSPFRSVGNVIEATAMIDAEVVGSLNKYVTPSSAKPRTLIRNVELSLTMGCASVDNLLRALQAERQEQVASTYVQDFCASKLRKGDFLVLDKKGVTTDTASVSLRDVHGDSLGSLLPGQFKEITSGIEILEDITAPGLSVVRVMYDYDQDGLSEIEFASRPNRYTSVYFKGTNYNGDLFDAVFHKVLFAPINSLDIVNDGDFLTLNLMGSVEEDGGKYFRLIKQGASYGTGNDIWY